MEVEIILRELANVVNRAWYKCKSGSPNSEMLVALSAALADAALERQRTREQQEAHDREMAAVRERHAAEEKGIRERMPTAETA